MTSGRLQGQGFHTENKIRGISGLLRINLGILLQIRKKYRSSANAAYFHFDLNCGSGWNHDVKGHPDRIPGTPLAFLDAIDDLSFDHYHAWFVDKRSDAVDQLKARPELATRPSVDVKTCDNESFVPQIPELIREKGVSPSKAYGTVLLDPNGPTGVPWDSVATLFEECKRLDCIFNFPGTGMKRLPSSHGARVEIEQVPRLFQKKHWLVRQPSTDVWQWVLLIGRNFPAADWRKEGFFDWDSTEGTDARSVVLSTRQSTRHPRQPKLL